MAQSLLFSQTNSGTYICLFGQCRVSSLDFSGIVNHLISHDIKLKANIDYCYSCEVPFSCKLGCLEHYLSHALDGRLFDRSVSEMPEKTADWLDQAFSQLENIRKDLWKHFLSEPEDEIDELPETQIDRACPIDIAEYSGSSAV